MSNTKQNDQTFTDGSATGILTYQSLDDLAKTKYMQVEGGNFVIKAIFYNDNKRTATFVSDVSSTGWADGGATVSSRVKIQFSV